MKRYLITLGILIGWGFGSANVYGESIDAKVRGQVVSVEAPSTSDPQARKTAADLFWRRAIVVILDDEMQERGVDVPAEDIQRRARELAGERFKQLDELGSDRQEKYKGVQLLTTEIAKALDLWKRDPMAGDAYAKENLERIGITPAQWEWLKQNRDNPSVVQSIESGQNYGDAQIIRESELQAERELQLEILMDEISRIHEIPPEVVHRMSLLIANRDRIQLLARNGSLHQSGLLAAKGAANKLGNDTLPNLRMLGPLRLDEPLPEWVLQEMAYATWGLKAIEKDVISDPIVILEGGELMVRQYQITELKSKELQDGNELSPDELSILKDTGRTIRFGSWLLKSLREGVATRELDQWLLGPL